MGCSASMAPSTVIQSIKRIDMGTNTDENGFSSNLINPVKHLVEISTQTEDLPIDVKTNETITFENNNDNKDLNLKSDDTDKSLDNRNESYEPEDNYLNPRLYQDLYNREELDWILVDFDAHQFSINSQTLLLSANQVTPGMVIDAIENTNDLQSVSKQIWNLLENARKTGDATYLIKAYTAESDFYKILNRKLARQILGNRTNMTLEEQLQTMMGTAFSQLGQIMSSVQALQAGQQMQFPINTNADWTILYLQAIYRFIMTPNSMLRYQGLTYRGMRLTLQELKRYTDAQCVCNKAITSTSKARYIAQNFIDCEPRPENMIDVMFIYRVESFSSLLAIDVHKLSLSPIEEEVLIMPGILFNIGKVEHITPYSVDIEMRSTFQDLANGGFANILS